MADMFHTNRRGNEHLGSKLSAELPSFSSMSGTGFAISVRENQPDQLATESYASAPSAFTTCELETHPPGAHVTNGGPAYDLKAGVGNGH